MRKKSIAVLSMYMLFSMCLPFVSFAEQSPSMAYSAEEWAALRDNKLEYHEIGKLIHEYNPTVLQNAISYKQYIGESSSDISQNYYDAAEKVYNNMQYPDENSANYASGVSSYLNAQIQYENLMKQGDNNTNDQETYKLKYEQQEANLVKQAKQKMMDFWKAKYNIRVYQNNVSTAEANLNSVRLKATAGTATASSVLTAEQNLSNAQTTLENAQVQLNGSLEELCLMCGWSYGANAEIGELPEVTAEMIAAMNPESDINTALEKNYSLRTTNRQLENAQNATVKEQLANTKNTSEQKIRNNINDLYVKVQSSQTELSAAMESLQLKESAKSTADRKKAAGMITEKDHNAAVLAYDTAAVQVQVKKIAVLNAYENYMSAVNGLAES